MDQIDSKIIFLNVALGLASSALWEGVKYSWSSYFQRERRELPRALPRVGVTPFLRNAVLIAIALTLFAIFSSSPAMFIS
jgi:hypothetical protein